MLNLNRQIWVKNPGLNMNALDIKTILRPRESQKTTCTKVRIYDTDENNIKYDSTIIKSHN